MANYIPDVTQKAKSVARVWRFQTGILSIRRMPPIHAAASRRAGLIKPGDRVQRGRIAQFDVFHPIKTTRKHLITGLGQGFADGFTCPQGLGRRSHGQRQGRRSDARRRIKPGIARRHGKPVRVAQRFAAHSPSPECSGPPPGVESPATAASLSGRNSRDQPWSCRKAWSLRLRRHRNGRGGVHLPEGC